MTSILKMKIDNDIQQMFASYKLTEGISHAPSKGATREDMLAKLLNDYLPDNYVISNKAIVIDSSGAVSNECDLVIYIKNGLRVQKINSVDYIPVENVKYVIEVKSTSTKKEIETTILKYRKLNSLIRSTEIQNIGNIVMCYYAYNSKNKTKDAEFKQFAELNGGYGPNPIIPVLCVANKGYYYYGNQYHEKVGLVNYQWSVVDNDREFNTKMFVIGIMNTLNPQFPVGYYVGNPGYIRQLYLMDVVNKVEVTLEKSIEFNKLQYALLVNDWQTCLLIANKIFEKDERNRLILSIGTMLLKEGNTKESLPYFEYLLRENPGDEQINEQVVKLFGKFA